MTHALAGTAALVTGASSGIGEATALTLAEHGAKVALAARRRERLEALAQRIRDTGGGAIVLTADVTNERAARDAVAATVAEFGRLDTVVNNAGLMLLGPIVGADPGEWQRMMELNVNALLHVTHAALPHLLESAQSEPRRVADLINVSSVAGRVARNGSGIYNATKHAVGAFSESLRQEVAKRHVRVSLVEPGLVATELAGHNRPEIIEAIHSRFRVDEPLQAADIAGAIAYIVTRPRHVAVNEILIRPSEQEP
jgi:NADP-dependent 3-hydroxy acid dehydrogenase YdfG